MTRPSGMPLQSVPAGRRQSTIARSVEVRGIGLHTGQPCSVTLSPGAAESGIRFRVGSDEMRLEPSIVCGTQRGTSLQCGSVRVHTVEHLLAALHGMGVDNVLIEVRGTELPALDGSALGWVEALESAGRVELDAEAHVAAPVAATVIHEGASWLIAEKSDRLSVTGVLQYDHPLLGTQVGVFDVDPRSFRSELAAARTYGFASEVEELRSRGLALGGTPTNALIIYDDRYSDTLRYPDECLRHKVLDLVGDLYVLGVPFRGRVTAIRPGHTANHALVRALAGLPT